jgi:hypothetical protein
LVIVLETPAAGTPLVMIKTEVGTLQGPDFQVTITDLNAPVALAPVGETADLLG